MENGPLISDFPIEPPIDRGFPIATFDYRRVYLAEICRSEAILYSQFFFADAFGCKLASSSTLCQLFSNVFFVAKN